MTTLPAPLGGSEFVAWRLDKEIHAFDWNSGEGAFRLGGRWNSRGVRCVYCCIDPATAILEVAVHTGFTALNSNPYVLTSLLVSSPGAAHIVQPGDVPNANWLRPGAVSAGQQLFGDDLLHTHKFVILPSTVSTNSWNLIFLAPGASGNYSLREQERFSLDTRLDAP